jgi:hypothetical protein
MNHCFLCTFVFKNNIFTSLQSSETGETFIWLCPTRRHRPHGAASAVSSPDNPLAAWICTLQSSFSSRYINQQWDREFSMMTEAGGVGAECLANDLVQCGKGSRIWQLGMEARGGQAGWRAVTLWSPRERMRQVLLWARGWKQQGGHTILSNGICLSTEAHWVSLNKPTLLEKNHWYLFDGN